MAAVEPDDTMVYADDWRGNATSDQTSMLRQWIVIVILLFLGVILWWVHDTTTLPPGVEAKGPQDWVPWVSLAGSIASFATALVTLGLKLIELRQKKA